MMTYKKGDGPIAMTVISDDQKASILEAFHQLKPSNRMFNALRQPIRLEGAKLLLAGGLILF